MPAFMPRPAERLLLGLALALAVGLAQAAPRVVASVAPLHSLTAAVMHDVGVPQLLLRGGESPHTFSLRPSDARMLHHADVLLWVGPELERPLARILPNLPDVRSAALIDAAGVERLPVRSLNPGLEGGAPAGHQHPPHDAAVDPHIWLSPTNAMAIAAEIVRILSEQDPANAMRYRTNGEHLRERLLALDARLRRQFATVSGSFMVFHDAYQYLEHAYALHAAGTVTTHPERSPGVAHLAELRRRLSADKVRCLFSEPQFQPRLVTMLGEGLTVRHAVLDPLGADIPPGPEAYERMMQAIADRFTNCMQGAHGA